ncbi:2,3-diphosphoglycerate-dependent phosphoglycerate mutase GpmB [Thorsellia anophelis]|uniref:Probable phosphoglycerate mutase n=1 Tax=Thorsellia anophelis DSM 18579 TaxID=1123402 RepID=A0A1I0DRW0_9GAMM|nr:2,3-diphosphoglycerate-dependent phosphoglycerate mutase GpmB [Thorsellia anophelis]SET34673.1 probable phosphoglycerate mutase [Thorsellia anophelis DSM 18579]
MTIVYLVRHGETQWNAQKRIQGQADSPLTEEGRIQAKQVAMRVKNLGITHLISSDLGRAVETAEILAQVLMLPVQTDKRLRELDMGILEGKCVSELTPEEDMIRRSPLSGTPDARIPNGESMQELANRLHDAIDDLRMLPDGSVPLLVCHGLALGCLIGTVMGLPAHAPRRIRLRNCSLSRIDYQAGEWLAEGWIVETAGDISHLESHSADEL